MYDMYPEWGPAKHRDDETDARSTATASFDLRDGAGDRPDDN